MSKKLIITEKPSVARDFARVLNVSGNKNGYIENNEYVISWCYGHLVQMVYPEDYDPSLKKWNLADLPFLPKEYKYGVIENSKEQYKVVNSLLHREDIDTVYWAGDSGKEGQTIEENIRNFGGVREGMTELRVWIDSQTDDEIRRGISEAKPMSDYDLLGKSGIMRAIEDYSLGINFSRVLSVKYGKLINDAAATKSYTAIAIGRVMTCVLGMVVNREREIRNFVETPFFRIMGDFSPAHIMAEWKAAEGSRYFNSPLLYKENGFKEEESANKFIEELSGKTAKIKTLDKGVTKKRAPLLFNLAELQSECSKIFKINPNQTLQIVQELYERKLTTYPRTDARVLTKAVAKEISKTLYKLKGYEKYSNFVDNILKNNMYQGLERTTYVDDSKVIDHYAIIPTGQTNAINGLSNLQLSVYDLIVRRFLSIFYPSAEYKTIKMQVDVSGEIFSVSSKVLLKPGFLEIAGMYKNKSEDTDSNEDNDAPANKEVIDYIENLKENQEISVNEYVIKDGKTSPPKRYTSGNLILAMENAGNLIEDEELREQIKNTGIGTSATRGEILDKLIRIGYLNQNNKTQIISPEKLGEMIYEVVLMSFPTLLNPKMTASWEKGLEGIVNGSVDVNNYRLKLEDYIRTETNKVINADLAREIANNINQFTGKESKGLAARKKLGIKCPSCGGELITTPFGYGCNNYFNEDINCKFNLGQIAGLDLKEEDFISLVTDGHTNILDGFVGKNKTKFKAALVLTKSDNGKFNVSFDFSNVKPDFIEDLFCPECKGKMVKTGYGYACENHFLEDNPCYFAIGKIADKALGVKDVKDLLTNGSTDVLKGFKSKSKTSFNAKLKLEKNAEEKYAITFDFNDIAPEVVANVKCPDCGGDIQIKSFGYGCVNYRQDDENSCHFAIGKIAGKALSVGNVTELLKDGQTKTIRGFKSKNGKKFDACLVLKRNDLNKAEIAFDFENVEAKVIKDVVCPVCGGEIVKTSFGYGCKNYSKDEENGCKFSIGKISNVNINESQLKELLSKGITSTISGFKSKKGTKFDAKLALDKSEEGVVKGIKFVFEAAEEIVLSSPCPHCNGRIIKGLKGYRCENYSSTEENKCSFFVGKIAGVEISKEQLEKLISEKKTDKIAGFISKKGACFDAFLKLDENNNIIFEFE